MSDLNSTPSPATEAGPARLTELGRRLRVLTGVDEELLAKVPHDRARYTALGGVVLGTAAIATFSMFLALAEAIGGASILLVPLCLLWGVFVLNLDRWLVASATGTQWGKRLALLIPRLALAVFFGVIVAEPLVLRVFQTAIENDIQQQRQDELGTLRTGLIACNPVPGQDKPTVDPASPYCHDYRLDIAVDPAGDANQLAIAQSQASTLQSIIKDESDQLATLTAAANDECAGATGQGLTGKVGYGRQCMDRWATANQYAAAHPVAQQQQQLAVVQTKIATLSTRVDTDQASYQSDLTTAVNQRVTERREQQGSIGMLERFQALSDLTDANGFLFTARWALSVFFILVDCLPVLGKLIGGITAYDRLVESASGSSERVFEANTRQTEDALIDEATTRRYISQALARKEREEVDLDLLRHKTSIERRMDEETHQLTERLLRQTHDSPRFTEITIPMKPLPPRDSAQRPV